MEILTMQHKFKSTRSWIALIIAALLVSACGLGNQNGSTNYYSAATDTYYKIESSTSNSVTTYSLSIVNSTAGLNNATLTALGNGMYSFNNGAGILVLSNGNLSIVAGNNVPLDFASANTTSEVPDGTYNSLCGYTTPSPCVVTINNNDITIIESDATSGDSIMLCDSMPIYRINSATNPNASTFSCSSYAIWTLVPFTVNGVTGLMLAEPNADTNLPYQFTSEIAFPVDSNPAPNGTYDYAYNQVNADTLYSSQGIESSISASDGRMTNSITSAVNAYLNPGYAYLNGAQYSMPGFAYYAGNATNYNLVGNDTMDIYQDSYLGFYLVAQ